MTSNKSSKSDTIQKKIMRQSVKRTITENKSNARKSAVDSIDEDKEEMAEARGERSNKKVVRRSQKSSVRRSTVDANDDTRGAEMRQRLNRISRISRISQESNIRRHSVDSIDDQSRGEEESREAVGSQESTFSHTPSAPSAQTNPHAWRPGDPLDPSYKRGPGRGNIPRTVIAKALRACGGWMTGTAKMLGVSVQAISKRIKDDPKLKAVYEESKEEHLDIAESKLVEALRKGYPWAVQFMLKFKGKERGYREHDEQQQSHKPLVFVYNLVGGQPGSALPQREMKQIEGRVIDQDDTNEPQ